MNKQLAVDMQRLATKRAELYRDRAKRAEVLEEAEEVLYWFGGHDRLGSRQRMEDLAGSLRAAEEELERLKAKIGRGP